MLTWASGGGESTKASEVEVKLSFENESAGVRVEKMLQSNSSSGVGGPG